MQLLRVREGEEQGDLGGDEGEEKRNKLHYRVSITWSCDQVILCLLVVPFHRNKLVLTQPRISLVLHLYVVAPGN